MLLRFLQERGYEPDYQGSTTMNFYLRRISRGDIAYRANVPEHLWELILRDGITTNDNYDRDSIGEFDYTQGSGWILGLFPPEFCLNDHIIPPISMWLLWLPFITSSML